MTATKSYQEEEFNFMDEISKNLIQPLNPIWIKRSSLNVTVSLLFKYGTAVCYSSAPQKTLI